MSGFGTQPAGSSPYGVGTPALAAPLGGSVLRDPTSNRPCGSRRLDPFTKDYVVDTNGRILGMNDVQQLVELAVCTERGSSAVRSLGQELKKIDRITDNFQRRVKATLDLALLPLTDRGLITIVSLKTDKLGNGRAYIALRWRDLTTGDEITTSVK